MHDLSSADHPSDPAPDADRGSVACQVVVRGRVQGVFFRASTQERASSLGVVGWVRNTADGSVEAWFEGSSAAVEQLLGWVRAGGPPAAEVDDLDVSTREPGGHRRFEVR